jgi:hypothetical protein
MSEMLKFKIISLSIGLAVITIFVSIEFIKTAILMALPIPFWGFFFILLLIVWALFIDLIGIWVATEEIKKED